MVGTALVRDTKPWTGQTMITEQQIATRKRLRELLLTLLFLFNPWINCYRENFTTDIIVMECVIVMIPHPDVK